MSDRQFYVYIHTKPDGTPFYVGKGSANRNRDFNKRNRHHKIVVAKYGRENIGILTFNCESEQAAHAMEIEYIRQFREAGVKLTNVCDGGEGATGAKRSPETRAKMAAAKLGFRFDAAAKKKMSDAAKNRVVSKVTRAKFAARMVGNSFSKGRSPSEETRLKMTIAHTGRKHSDDTLAKMSIVQQARWATTVCSDETRAKQSAAQKRRFAK